MMGKEARFKEGEEEPEPVGPGAYQIEEKNKKMGGFIPKGEREMNNDKRAVPGPGAYKI